MTYFSSGRLSRPQSSLEAWPSAWSISSSIQTNSRMRAAMVTCERWLWAPRSEIFFEHGHRLVTGTSTFSVKVSRPSAISPTKVTS